MEAIFDRIAALVSRLLGAPIAGFAVLADPHALDQGVELLGAVGFPGPLQRARQVMLPGTVTASVAARGSPLALPEASADPEVAKAAAQFGASDGAIAAHPLYDGGEQPVGALLAASPTPRPWTQAELDTLADLAALGSSELQLRTEQARAVAAEASARRAHEDSEMLLRMSEAFAQVTTLEQIEQAITFVVRADFDAAEARLAVLDPAQGSIAFVSPAPEAPDGVIRRVRLNDASPVCAVANSGRARFYPNAAGMRREYPMLLDLINFPGACLLVPVKVGDELRAVVSIRWARPRGYDHRVATAETALAPFVAHALDRVALLDNQRRVASTLQQALLTPPPSVPGLELATAYLAAQPASAAGEASESSSPPAKEPRRLGIVGGDWYDVIKLDDSRTVLVIGDVAGHDMAAAGRMGQLRVMARTLTWSQNPSPAQVLTLLDRANAELGPGTDATAVVARLQRRPDGFELEWSNAGHLPPLVLRADGSVAELDGRADLLLGLVPETARANHRGHLGPGDTLVLYTDGLIEQRGAPLRSRIEVLRLALAKQGQTATSELPGALIAALDRASPPDDVAVLVARVREGDEHPAPQGEQRRQPLLRAVRDVTDDVADLAPVRRWLDDLLESDAVSAAVRSTATLLANELVTNAVRHAHGPIAACLVVDHDAQVLRFTVTDGSSEPPVLRYPEPQETSGRGIQLVARLATRWGTTPGRIIGPIDIDPPPGGKAVWFELNL